MICSRRLFLIAVTIGFLAGCTNDDRVSEALNCTQLLNDVTVLPFHDGTKVEGSYNYIIDHGKNEDVTTCLYENIINTVRIDDVRESRMTRTIAKGDVSVFLLSEIYEIKFLDFLPENTHDNHARNGVFAYHAYAETDGAREEIAKVFKTKICDLDSAKGMKFCED